MKSNIHMFLPVLYEYMGFPAMAHSATKYNAGARSLVAMMTMEHCLFQAILIFDWGGRR
jgi:hypothetical protein